jgi:hypothetical protein
MSNYTFACASVNGLTLAQKRETVIALRASIKAEVAARKAAKIADKAAKQIAKENKAFDRAAKKAARIAKLEAKLAALKNPVGIAAKKANKKPSKVTVLKMAA